MRQHLMRPWPKRNTLVVELGAIGSGKTMNGLSIKHTIARRHPYLQVVKTNREFTEQARTLGRHHGLPQRTHRDKPETMTIQTHNTQIDWEFWAGENAMFNEAIDAKEIDALLRSRGVDLLVMTLNPFQHDLDLAEYAFIELTWWIQQKTAFTLGKSAGIAAELLWGFNDEADLKKLNADFDELTEAQLRDGRVVRQPTAKFGLPLVQCFRIEGCDAGADVLDIFARTARTTGAHTLEVLNLRAVAACRPEGTIVAGTHADLLPFLPGVGECEFLRSCRDIFPDSTQVRIGQVVSQASLDITIRKNRKEPVWRKGPSDRSGPLLESVFHMLARSNRPDPSRRGWAIAAVALIALATLPIAALVSSWALLPLGFIIAWAVVFCIGFSPQRKRTSPQRKAKPDAITAESVPPTAHNRIAEQLQHANGTTK